MSKRDYPSLNSLRQFVEVYEAKGIARAARNLGLTQPALSKNIKRLEEIVGAPLLDRHTRGTALTRAGESFLHHATKALHEFEHGLESARKSAGFGGDELRIGAGLIFAMTLIPNAIPKFHDLFPHHRIKVSGLPFDRIEEALDARRIDIAAHAIPEDFLGQLVRRPIYKAKRSIICSAEHPLMRSRSPIPLDKLSDYPFVFWTLDSLQLKEFNQRLYRRMADPPRISVETDAISDALEIVRQGRHLLLSNSLLAKFSRERDLAVLPIDEDLGEYQIGFCYRKDLEINSATKGFMAIVQESLKVVSERSSSD